MAAGALWMVFFKFTERGLGLISTVILARLLIPKDFGLVAMATSIIAVLELLSAFSFDIVLIHKQEATRNHYDTAWTFNVSFGVISALILLALANPAAAFYSEPRLDAVMYVLALGSLVHGFENIGVIAFRKDLEFRKEFYFLLSKKLVSFSVTLPLAFIFRNYWALIAGMLAGRTAGVLVSYYVHPYRPWFSLKARHELLHFSKWLFFNNIITFLNFRSPDFIVGKISGARALGLYNIAHEISNLPTTELVAPINRAVFPAYAKMSEDISVLRQGYLNVIAVIALFSLPIGSGIAVISELAVAVFLGDKWVDAASIISILAFYGITISLLSNSGSVLMAAGKPHYITAVGGINIAVLIPVIIFTTLKYGVLGTAWGYLGTTLVVLLPVTYITLFRLIRVRLGQFLAMIWRPVAATAIMFFAVRSYLSYTLIPTGMPGKISVLLLAISLGAALYTISIFILWLISSKPEGAESYILGKLRFDIFTKKRST
jgi:O-antigen/teichoic acid export membrane protein